MSITMDIVQRLRFDSVRCETQFSKGVASNIEEGAAEIERLRAALKPFAEAAKHFKVYPKQHEGSQVDTSITLGDLRRAAAAYEQKVDQ